MKKKPRNLGKNFKQAVKELLNGPKKPDTQHLLQPEEWSISPPEPEMQAEEIPAVTKPADKLPARKNLFTGSASATSVPGSTIIADGDTFQGNLQCTGNIEIYGAIIGDIVSKGDIKFCGKQQGNSSGHNIEMSGGQITGSVIANGSMKMNDASVVIGDIVAETLVLNGKAKGDLEIQSSVTLEKNAVVFGKVSAGSISVENGAAIEGEVAIHSPAISKLTENETILQ